MLKTLLRSVMRWLFKVEVRGKAEELRAERLLIIANHQSFLDGFLLGLFLPYNAMFVVHTSVAKRWSFRLMLSMVDYLAVDPSNPMAMKGVVKAVEAGRPVVVFPQGPITLSSHFL